jgi:hypothetical protein
MVLRVLAGAAAGLEFALETRNFLLVLGLDLDVLLLQRVDLAADHLNLLDVTLDLSLVVDAAVGLGVELGADLVEQLVETLARGTGRGADARRVVVHGGAG